MEHGNRHKITLVAHNSSRGRHYLDAGWDNNGKPGNQVAKKSSHKIFGRNPAIITKYLRFIY